ncbi:MAG: Holliday junction branch migration protein RuvA [Candidatus Altimarinota bacterium]
MFAYIRGTVLSVQHPILVCLIEGTGLGLEIFSSPGLLSSAISGQMIEISIHHHMTEMGETLFGFINTEERELFRSLLKVSGVGGKTALNILGLGHDAIVRAIQFEDDGVISSVPGIGKKTAQKIIVDLKGSIDFKKTPQTPMKNNSDSLLISSLVQMGYDKTRVEEVIQGISSELPIDKRTIEAIRKLAS